jgi:RNA polymerase sigma factor (sigma-70 family)
LSPTDAPTVEDRERILREHLPLVRRIAARYRGLGLPDDDLVQEGMLGVLDACEQYDPERGTAFKTYAAMRARRAIGNALTDRGRLVRLPKQMVERRRAIARASTALMTANGRRPTTEELIEATGLSAAAIVDAQSAGIEPYSLDEPITDDGSPLEAIVADATAVDPERALLTHDQAELVDAAVSHLPPRQREIVEKMFGFDQPAEPIAEVATELHLSAQRTRTLAIDALSKLREELERIALVAFRCG